MKEKILTALKDNDKVVVFTQSASLIVDVLKDTELRGKILCSEIWGKFFLSGLSFVGDNDRSNSKFYLNGDGDEQIVIDIPSFKARLMFTKNPFYYIPPGCYIIKDDFVWPKLKIVQSLSPMLLAQKLSEKRLYIKTDGMSHYQKTCQQFILQGVEFSCEEDYNGNDLCITNTISIDNSYDYVALYGLYAVGLICAYDNFKWMCLVVPELSMVDKILYAKIMQCFDELAGYAAEIDYFTFKLTLSPQRVRGIMALLENVGVVSRVMKDASTIVIKKSKTVDDATFKQIPEGQFTVHELAHIMGGSVDYCLKTLKLYENNGIVFAYDQKFNSQMWKLRDVYPYHVVEDICKKILIEKQFLSELEKDESHLNRYITSKIESYCVSNKTKAIIKDKNNYIEIDIN